MISRTTLIMEAELWRKKLEREFAVYDGACAELDDICAQCGQLEGELLNSSTAELEQAYYDASVRKGVLLRRVGDLSMLLENYLAEYERVCQEAERHGNDVRRIRALPAYTPGGAPEKSLEEVLRDPNGPILFSDKTFEDFERDFRARWAQHEDEYRIIMAKDKRPAPRPRAPYSPRVPLGRRA